MNNFTPFQLEYYNSHARSFASLPKNFLIWLIQPLFCVLFASQLFHEYYNAAQNWLYFFALCLVIINAVAAACITVIYWALCIASWIESLSLELKNKTQSMRLKIMSIVLIKKNIIFYLDILTDIIMAASFVSVGYPFLGISYAAVVSWQHFMLYKSKKKILKFIAALEDPFEDAEKENIDDLANKLFHGE